MDNSGNKHQAIDLDAKNIISDPSTARGQLISEAIAKIRLTFTSFQQAAVLALQAETQLREVLISGELNLTTQEFGQILGLLDMANMAQYLAADGQNQLQSATTKLRESRHMVFLDDMLKDYPEVSKFYRYFWGIESGEDLDDQIVWRDEQRADKAKKVIELTEEHILEDGEIRNLESGI